MVPMAENTEATILAQSLPRMPTEPGGDDPITVEANGRVIIRGRAKEDGPTTELVLAHKHPEDRPQIAAAIEEMLATHEAFSTRHRIVDTGGDIHQVVVVGDQLHDDHGAVVGTHGFYVAVAREVEQEQLVTEKLVAIAENRAAIEQAKGMLMLIYGIDENAAFDLLKWLSQEHNVKLRPLAERICTDFRNAGPTLTSQSEFDHLLLTTHERVGRPSSPRV